MLMGAAAFGSRARPRAAAAGALGGLAPDLASFALVAWAALVQRRGAGEIFGALYFSPAWQAVMAPSHSVALWTAGLAAALLFRRPLIVAFAASGLLHQAFDFAFHAEDAHRHLWPFSDWRFISPLSYWDLAHHAAVVAPIETLAALGLAVWLATVYRTRWARAALALLALTYVAQIAAFVLIFRG